MSEESFFYGRSVLKEEIKNVCSDETLNAADKTPAFEEVNGKKRCARCGTYPNRSNVYPCVCGGDCVYCRECIALGKVRACAQFYSMPEPNCFKRIEKPYLHWAGLLSAQQAEASKVIARSVQDNKETIVWAVAGAGKTEMLFEGIQFALENNKRVCIASPRIDVCLELAPRIQRVFPEVPVSVLYGGAEEAYQYTQLVIATVHQLYRFKEAFDVIIIDEVDAFPYHMNAGLLFAVKKARKVQSSLIYLTATPDKEMKKRIRNNAIESVILPARYHGHPLPVPKIIYHGQEVIDNKKSDQTRLIRHMKQLIENHKRFLVFIPTILLMEKIEPVITKTFAFASFTSVHAKDSQRKEKIIKMRKGELDFLLTTTILERGVTFENIDVIIWRADHHVFTEAALVQIAGRAGRTKEHPQGEVTFYHLGWTRAMKKALKQIKEMNARATERGLIQ